MSPRCAFQFRSSGKEARGIHDTTFQSSLNGDVDIQKTYTATLGPWRHHGVHRVGERLGKELTALAPSAMKIKAVAPPERKYSVWIGGSIILF